MLNSSLELTKRVLPPRVKRRLKRLLPRKRGTVEHYKSEFPESASAFLKFLKRCEIPNVEQGDPVGMVIMPWMGTPAPWFSMMLAVGLAQRGKRVTFIWDDTAFPTPSSYIDLQNRKIGEMFDYLGDKFAVIRLSEQSPSTPREGDEARLTSLVNQNLTWMLRGALPSERDRVLGETAKGNLRHTLALIRGLFARHQFRYLVITGGIYGSSGLFLLAGSEAGVRASTYDAGIGAIFVSTDGVAAQQTDLARAFQVLWESDHQTVQAAISQAQAEFSQRRVGKDKQAFQVTAGTIHQPNLADTALIPLSVEWDSAALGRHTFFENTLDWVGRTVEFILNNSEHHIIVRRHPGERKKYATSYLPLEPFLKERFGENPRLRLIRADDPVNSYELIEASSLVLPYVSTIAIEAAALGKPVVSSARCYYSEMGFLWSAQSREEYFDLVLRGLRSQLPTLPQQRERAWLCYYLSQACNLVWTPIAPPPQNYWDWVGRPPQKVIADPAIQDALTALDENVPISLLRHQRRAGSRAASWHGNAGGSVLGR